MIFEFPFNVSHSMILCFLFRITSYVYRNHSISDLLPNIIYCHSTFNSYSTFIYYEKNSTANTIKSLKQRMYALECILHFCNLYYEKKARI